MVTVWGGKCLLCLGGIRRSGGRELGVFAVGLASQRPAAAARLGYVGHFVLTYSGQQS